MNIQVRLSGGALTFFFVGLLWLGATSASAAQDIPSNAHRNIGGNGWECNRGYSRVGNNCQPVTIPANARLDYYGHGWECNKGYARLQNQCVAVMIPANGKLDYYGHGWECNKGYARVQNECVVVVIPANGKLDYYGHGWECNKGYARIRNECVAVMIPANAKLDYYGHGWECNKGYRRVGNECEAVIIPTNASLDYYGHAWVCHKGYRRLGNECVSATTSGLPAAASATLPRTERFTTVPMRSPSPIETTSTSPLPESSLSLPNDRTAAVDVSASAATANSAVPQVTIPNDPAKRRPSPQRRVSAERSPRPANAATSNSVVNSLQNRPASPVTPAEQPTNGTDNSLSILVGIFLVFGFLRLTGVVRP